MNLSTSPSAIAAAQTLNKSLNTRYLRHHYRAVERIRWLRNSGTLHHCNVAEMLNILNEEWQKPDAADEMGELFCRACGWTGEQDACDTKTPRHGKGYGHTPDDVDLLCPKCGASAEEC